MIPPDGVIWTLRPKGSRDLTEAEMMRVRKNFGMVFQEGALFDSLSVYENVAYRLHEQGIPEDDVEQEVRRDRKSTRLNSSHWH